MSATLGESIPIETLPNLRNLGGYLARDNRRVASGRLFRSAELGRLADSDIDPVRELGVKTVFDLRTAVERKQSPDRDIGAREVVLDVMADRDGDGPTGLFAKVGDPEAIREALAGGRGVALMKEAYRGLVELPSARHAYGRFFTALADGGTVPALFHCTAGKDRTGWAAAVTLLFLGVSDDDVFHDYLLTNEQLLPALQPIFDGAAERGIEADLLRPVLGVERAYLQTALDAVETRYGDIATYMSEGLALGDDVLSGLEEALLVAPHQPVGSASISSIR